MKTDWKKALLVTLGVVTFIYVALEAGFMAFMHQSFTGWLIRHVQFG
jgi:hypothetical protein